MRFQKGSVRLCFFHYEIKVLRDKTLLLVLRRDGSVMCLHVASDLRCPESEIFRVCTLSCFPSEDLVYVFRESFESLCVMRSVSFL